MITPLVLSRLRPNVAPPLPNVRSGGPSSLEPPQGQVVATRTTLYLVRAGAHAPSADDNPAGAINDDYSGVVALAATGACECVNNGQERE